jgi:CubicO group peptidase (beta-lactamase class C family)
VRSAGAAAALVALGKAEFSSIPSAFAQDTQAPAGAAWVARHGLTSAQYQSEFNTWTSQGYRLIDVSGYEEGGEARYAAIWQKYSSPAWWAYHGVSGAEHQSRFNQLAAQGFRMVHATGYNVNGTVLYAAIWEQASGQGWWAYHGVTAADHQNRFNQLSAQGYRMIDVSGYEDGGQARYAAIWVQTDGRAWQARHGLTSAGYQAAFDQLTSHGYRLARVSGYGVGGTDYYAAIFEKTPGPMFAARHNVAGPDYQGVFDQWRYQGFRPTCVDGYSVGGQTRFAAVFENVGFNPGDLTMIWNTVNGVLQANNVPGASIAIGKDGRLVYAAGFGNLDSAGHAVSPTNLFRVASMSKPITSVAIMRLKEQGRLNLNDKVFGRAGILGTRYGSTPYTSNMQAITIDHLLHHTAGSWENNGSDPMFVDPSWTHAQLIGWVLDNTTDGPGGSSIYHLATPGSAYAYSNFGYCVLGRVIEAVSGQSYTTYVQQNVLSSCGINNMHIGGNTLADRRADESQYFGQGEDPYNMNVARMDSHGGWIASSIDYLRLLVRVDGFATKPDIITGADLATMWTGSTANAGYGQGWILTGSNRWHNGALPGTQSIGVRTGDGFTWVALFNSRGANTMGAMDSMMWTIRNSVRSWPGYDLL